MPREQQLRMQTYYAVDYHILHILSKQPRCCKHLRAMARAKVIPVNGTYQNLKKKTPTTVRSFLKCKAQVGTLLDYPQARTTRIIQNKCPLTGNARCQKFRGIKNWKKLLEYYR